MPYSVAVWEGFLYKFLIFKFFCTVVFVTMAVGGLWVTDSDLFLPSACGL